MKKLITAVLLLSGIALADCTPTPTSGTGGLGWDTPTATSITFHWTTTTACTSSVMYGVTDAWGAVTTLADTGGVTTHTVTVTGLDPATGYLFSPISGDAGTGANAKAPLAQLNSGSVISTAAVPSGSLIYTVRLFGNRKLARGYGATYQVAVTLSQATTPQVYTVKLSGMPTGVTMNAIAATAGTCSSGNATATSYDVGYYLCYKNSGGFGSAGSTAFTLNAASNATLGAFTLTVAVQSVACPTTCTATIPITVYDPSFTVNHPGSYPALTNLSTWNSNMVTYADRWGTIESPPGTFHPQYGPYSGYGVSATCGASGNGCAVYYDGAAAWYRIVDYASSHGISLSGWAYPSATYAGYNSKVYYTFVNTAGTGGTPTLPAQDARFPLGIYRDCTLNGTTDACTATDYMGHNLAYGATELAQGVGLNPVKIREVTYDFWMARIGLKRSINTTAAISSQVDRLLYIADSITNGYDQDQAGEQPFMDGLVAEALLKCYHGIVAYGITETASPCYHDPRIPQAVKELADHVSSTYYDSSVHYFKYNASWMAAQVNTPSAYIALNMLIIPMYAWLYRQTGDTTYSNLYNDAFGATALDTSWTWDAGNGKPVTQQLRWGMDGIDCMTPNFPCLGEAPPPTSFTLGGVSVGGTLTQ